MDRTLRWLLSQARLGPSLRLPAMRALGGRRPEAIQAAGRAVIRSLIQRGDLVRVRIEGADADAPREIYALRGHANLLDLEPFLAGEPLTPAAPPPAVPAPDACDIDSVDLLGVLERMQEFQLLPALHDGGAAWLEALLSMLDDVLPDATVHLELHDAALAPEHPAHVFHTPPGALPFWARIRRRGESCRLGRREDLPPHLRDRADEGAGFTVQVTPVLAPDPEPASQEPREAGLLYLCADGPRGDAFVELARRLSRFVTHSWRHRLRVGRLVHTDPLTGVHNRGSYDEQIGVELERCRRHGTPLVLLLGDLDHFKRVNDTHGHPMGDRVLKTVARELQEGLRRIDLVCRVGGEEFALILPDTDLEAAREVITRLQVRIANLRLTDAASPEALRVTMSFGGAVFPEAGTTPEALYEVADQMLYLSKQRGRNRCHFWRPDSEPLLTLPAYREG
ncbi:MAG TPA: GGDEF domain-containing protein [Candidatus Krumholzibacteria bacterium]|nr:GGDEF domain-containing protein [Candidatus Krumholzibacteria bacterium]